MFKSVRRCVAFLETGRFTYSERRVLGRSADVTGICAIAQSSMFNFLFSFCRVGQVVQREEERLTCAKWLDVRSVPNQILCWMPEESDIGSFHIT